MSKFIPEGQYLLDDVKIETDNKEIKSSQLSSYVRQTPNAKWFSLVKLPMYIYCASGTDSTKWFNRLWRKLGDAPVVYSRNLADETRGEIEKAVQNRGYMGAVVELDEEHKGNKMKVCYRVFSGNAYTVDRIEYNISDEKLREYIYNDTIHSLLHTGMRFDVNVLDEERQRITQYLQNRGYYRFNKDFITFQADTLLHTYKIGLTLNVLPYRRRQEDAPSEHRQYTIRNVNYLMDVDPISLTDSNFRMLDSVSVDGINIYYKDKLFA